MRIEAHEITAGLFMFHEPTGTLLRVETVALHSSHVVVTLECHPGGIEVEWHLGAEVDAYSNPQEAYGDAQDGGNK